MDSVVNAAYSRIDQEIILYIHKAGYSALGIRLKMGTASAWIFHFILHVIWGFLKSGHVSLRAFCSIQTAAPQSDSVSMPY